MNSLLAAMDDEIIVEHGLFGLIDDDRVPPGELSWLGLGIPDSMRLGVNAAIFRSGGTDHFAAVRLESWSGEPGTDQPPAPAGGWDTVWTGELGLTSGRVQLVAVAARASERLFTVGGPGRYRLVAYCTGRAAAQRASSLVDGYQHGVERWVLRFWPV